MDGTFVTTIISTDLESPYGLTLDYDTQTLYWIDAHYDRVEQSNVNGSERIVLTNSGISNPFDIEFYQGTLYWTDSSLTKVSSFTVSPPGSVEIVAQSITSYTPYGMHVVSEERQPQGMKINQLLSNC